MDVAPLEIRLFTGPVNRAMVKIYAHKNYRADGTNSFHIDLNTNTLAEKSPFKRIPATFISSSGMRKDSIF